jgi:hypothetical protein
MYAGGHGARACRFGDPVWSRETGVAHHTMATGRDTWVLPGGAELTCLPGHRTGMHGGPVRCLGIRVRNVWIGMS